MSWDLQNLNQHTNSAVYPFGNNTFPVPRSYSSNTNLPQYQTNTHIHPINGYNNTRNAFRRSNIPQINRNQTTASHCSNTIIPKFTGDQFKHIKLPPLPQELQLNNTHISTNCNNSNRYNGPSFSNQYPIKCNSSNINELLSNGHTININHVNTINNIKNVNINQNGTIHNTINPHFIMNNVQQSNGNQFIQQFIMKQQSPSRQPIPKSFSFQQNAQNRYIQQRMQNTLNNGKIMQSKPKKRTQNRIKLRFKRPQFHVNKQSVNNNDNNAVIKHIKPVDIPPPVAIIHKTPPNKPLITRNDTIDAMNIQNDDDDNLPTTVTTDDKVPLELPSPKPIVMDDNNKEEIIDEALFVDVNGVLWDNTVNWVCGVCDGADAQKDNALVVCEGCSRAVHEHCYGITQSQMSSDNDWYCECCEFKQYILNNDLINELRDIYRSINGGDGEWSVSRLTNNNNNRFDRISIPLNVLTDVSTSFSSFFCGSSLPRCSLCVGIGGSYKLSSCGTWVHMSCSIYHPDIYFAESLHSNDPVLSSICNESFLAPCSVCKSSDGACVSCTNSKCSKWFHITCSQQENLYLFYSPSESLIAYCAEHTQIFKNKRDRNCVSGKKRKRISVSPSKRRTRKRKKVKRMVDDGKKEFSPEPDDIEIKYITNRLNEYISNLLCNSLDDVSSISSQEIGNETEKETKKKRRKSAVDLLSHSSFALKRNKWIFNQTFHLFPNNSEFYESKDFEVDSNCLNVNHWKLETTTDPTQIVAEQCMRSVETLWSHRQTNLLAKSQNSRDYRKAIGFSILRNPSSDVITSCNWSFWEVSATKKAVLIKLFITEPFSKSHIPQRRKKNGTLLAAHVMDISFRLRNDVDWIVICSEKGIAEIFWRSLGFIDFSVQEKRSFCRGTEKDLNQFRDTILLRMHHNEYIKRYCDNTNKWDDDNCAVQKVFRKWRKKHLFIERNLIFKHKGKVMYSKKISSY